MRPKYNKLLSSISLNIGLVIMAIFLLKLQLSLIIIPTGQFTSPTKIKLEMFALTSNGKVDDITFADPHCSSTGVTHLAYGCTYFYNKPDVQNEPQEPYPFDSYQIEIGYDGETKSVTLSNGTQQTIQLGYLHNVVSQEIQEGTTLSAYAAQVIASRTYAYTQTNGSPQTLRINNSSGKQVYIPFRFEGLAGTDPTSRKTKVSNAVSLSSGYYMTLPNNNVPIFAAFGQDNCTYTQNNTANSSHLKSIYDPISAKPAGCTNSTYGTGGGGMGSSGASRWGFGNTNVANGGPKWSVQWGVEPGTISGDSWRNGFQILTHYYTGIAIRNASNIIVTPNDRWNALAVTWSGVITPPKMDIGSNNTYNTQVVLQNTGINDWTTSHYLSYRWVKESNNQTGANKTTMPSAITPGNAVTVTLGVKAPPNWDEGDYLLSLDMYGANETGFGGTWFTHNITFTKQAQQVCPKSRQGICIAMQFNYLPIILKNYPESVPTATPIIEPTPIATPPPEPTSIFSPDCETFFVDTFDDNPFNRSDESKRWLKAPSHLVDEDNDIIPGPTYDNSVVSFINDQRDIDHDDDEYDHAMYTFIGIPPGTVQLQVAFSLRMKSEEPLPGQSNFVDRVKDRIFFDIRKPDELNNGNYTTYKFACSNTNCNPKNEQNNVQGSWFTIEPVSYELPQINTVAIGFFANVDRSYNTTFYVDNVQVCSYK